MNTLIPVETARKMSDESVNSFVETGIIPYLEYLNEKITESAENGLYYLDLDTRPYSDLPDKVISKLSEPHKKSLVDYLNNNGYRAYYYQGCFYLSWEVVEEQKVETVEVPKKKPWWKFECWV